MRAFWQHFSQIGRAIKEFSDDSLNYKLACFLLAISRLLQMVSFFLPLKILIMLSSSEPPSYLEYLPIKVPYETALIMLIIMVPVTYCSYILAGILHRFYLDKDLEVWKQGSGRTEYIQVKSNDKLIKLHAHVAKAFSEVFLVSLALVLIVFIDFPVFFVIFFMVVANLNVFVMKAFYKNDQDRVGVFRLHRRQYIEYMSSVNFVLVFIVLAIQVKFFEIDVFKSLFVLLLSRLMFQAVQRFSIENLFIVSNLDVKKP